MFGLTVWYCWFADDGGSIAWVRMDVDGLMDLKSLDHERVLATAGMELFGKHVKLP